MISLNKIIFSILLFGLGLTNAALPETNSITFETRPSFLVDAGLQPNFRFTNGWSPSAPTPTNPVNRSKGKALFLSFLVPGLGEYYSGHQTRAKTFFITEVLLWSTYTGFKIYENWIEDEYQVFASNHALVDASDKAHKFYVNIGNYDNIYDYNAAKLNYRQLEDVYPDSYAWNWDSNANRHDFKMMRIRADNANYRALFALGAILLNHVVSAIDAVWVSRVVEDSDHQPKQSLNFQFDSQRNSQQYQLVFTKFF
jgi:hypothetical protein